MFNFFPRFIILSLVLFLSLNAKASSSCHIKVRVNQDPPQYMIENGQWVGKAVDLMSALLEEAGCTQSHHKMPWQRALIELEKGNIDAMMNVGYNEERAKHFHYIGPQTTETQVLVIRKDLKIDINSLEDLKKLPLKIGYEKGNIYDRSFMAKLNQDPVFKSIFEPSAVGNLTEMVLQKRLSGELNLIENIAYAFRKNSNYAEKLKIHPLKISSLPTFFAFSRKSVGEDLLLRLHEANVRAMAFGTYEKVKSRWQQDY